MGDFTKVKGKDGPSFCHQSLVIRKGHLLRIFIRWTKGTHSAFLSWSRHRGCCYIRVDSFPSGICHSWTKWYKVHDLTMVQSASQVFSCSPRVPFTGLCRAYLMGLETPTSATMGLPRWVEANPPQAAIDLHTFTCFRSRSCPYEARGSKPLHSSKTIQMTPAKGPRHGTIACESVIDCCGHVSYRPSSFIAYTLPSSHTRSPSVNIVAGTIVLHLLFILMQGRSYYQVQFSFATNVFTLGCQWYI